MKTYRNSLAGAQWQNGLAEQIVARAAEELANPSKIEVVNGDNKELSIRWTAFAVFAWACTIAVLVLGIYWQTRWSRGTLTIIGAAGLMVTLPVILVIASGDVPVLRQIGRNYRLEKLRLEGLADTAVEAMKLMKKTARWTHIEKMQELSVNAEIAELRALYRLAVDGQHMKQQPSEGIASPTFVPSEVAGARRLVADYVLGTPDKRGLFWRGELDGTMIAADGRFLRRAPWSARGPWSKDDSRKALDILMMPAPGAAPLIIEQNNGVYWNLKDYPTKAEVISVLGVV